MLLSTISWTNRAVNGNDADGFDAVFGPNANTARLDADAAFALWGRVIKDLKLSNGSNELDVTLTEHPGPPQGGNGGVNTVLNGKPTSGSINLVGSDYYLDPNPNDSSEFDGNIVNAFVGDAPPGTDAAAKGDYFTLVVLEMAHVLGFSKNSDLDIWTSGMLTQTGITIPVGQQESSVGLPGYPNGDNTYWHFHSSHTDALFNGNSQADVVANPSHAYDAVHMAASADRTGGFYPEQTITTGGVTMTTSEQSDDSNFYTGRRILPSLLVANVLADAFGYIIAPPQSFGTFYDNISSSGALLIRGGGPSNANNPVASNDVVSLSTSGSNLNVSVAIGSNVPGTAAPAAWVTQFNLNSISSVVIQAGEGNDTLNFGGGSLTSMPNATINMGSGIDTINVDDSAYTAAQTSYSLYSTQIGRTNALFGVPTFDSTVENVKFYPGSGLNNVVNLYSTAATTTIQSSNASIVNIGNNGNAQLIQGAVTITSPPNYTSLNIDDSADATGKNVIFSDHGLFGLCANINWTTSDLKGVTVSGGFGSNTFTVDGTDAVFGSGMNVLNTGSANDFVDILAMQYPLTVNGQTGTDSINVSPLQQNLDSIAGALTVTGSSSSTLNLDDRLSQNIIFTTYTFSNAGFNRVGQTVIAGQLVTRSESVVASGLGNVVLNAGAFGNVVNVEGASTPISINASPSTVAVVVSPSAENLNNVQNTVTVNGNSTLSLSIEDQNNVSVVPVQNVLTATSLTSLGYNYILVNGNIPILLPYFSLINFNNVGSLTFDAGTVANSYLVQGTAAGITTTVNAGSGQSTVNVEATTGPLGINGQGGSDTTTIGNTGNARAVAGDVTVGNVGGTTALTVDDSADLTGRSAVVTSSSVAGVAAGTVFYSSVSPLLIQTGAGAETCAVTSISIPTSITNVAGVINVTPASQNLDNIAATLTLTGSSASTLNIHDELDPDNLINSQAFGATLYNRFAEQSVGGQVVVHSTNIPNSGFGTVVLDTGAVTNSVGIDNNGYPITINAGTGTSIAIGTAHTLNGITAPITINGSGNNAISLDDSGVAAPAIVHVTSTSVGATVGDTLFGPGGSLTYHGATSLSLSTPNASIGDMIYVHPSATTAMTIGAHNPTTSPGDALTLADADGTNRHFTSNGTGAGQFTYSNRQPITYTGIESLINDNVAPFVINPTFNFNTLPLSLSFGFSEPLAVGPPLSAFLVTGPQPSNVPLSGVAFANNVAALGITGTLADGNYHANISASGVVDLSGNPMASDSGFDFFSLTGDANHDRFVNTMDFTTLAQNFNTVNAGASHGDFNYDGKVNALDFNILATKFGTHLLPAAAPVVNSVMNPAASASNPALPLATLFSVSAIKSGMTSDVLDGVVG